MKTYTLAHPLDAKIRRGTRLVDSPFTTEDKLPGDTIELEAPAATMLARAGYLNVDATGAPTAVDSGEVLTADDVPPRGGEGSDRDAWVAYAGGRVEITDDMKRDDVIAALDAAGIATHRSA